MPNVIPGPTITRSTQRGSRAGNIDTSTLFAIGFADRGSTVHPEEISGMGDYATKLGLRTGANGDDNSTLYDALDAYFALGGTRALVQRFVGPAAVTASITMLDGSAATVATVRAASPGPWGNTLTYTVQTNSEDATIPAGSFVVIVYLSGVEVERSPILADKTALLQWAPSTAGTGQSQYLALTSGASANDPAAVVARALTSGAGDRASTTGTQHAAALTLFTPDLGPGQVVFPGATTSASHALVQAHANSNGRVALHDSVDTATLATNTSLAATDRAATGNEFAAIFWPWVTIPGLTAGTVRTVSPATVAAALMAASDNAGNVPNVPAAGDNGDIGSYVIGLSQAPVDDTTRGVLNMAGINLFRPLYDSFRLYGYRTLADPVTNPNWITLSNSRMFNLLSARLNILAEGFEFDQIDPAKVAEFQGALIGVLSEYFPGALFGETFGDAARVDMSINTPEFLAANQLGATVEVRLSPYAERVPINVRKVAVSESLAA
jgi:hypothetical protein